jgi:phospholipid/cholesterol/gamma-HCH transport system ATP-binding protein
MNFGGTAVLKKVSLEVASGECVVLVGPSGKGKTVVLKLFAGLLKPSRGKVSVDGKDLNGLSHEDQEQVLLQMGMLFQKNALFDSLTVGENIAFPLREKTALSEAEIHAKVEYFLEAVGIGHARALFPDEISGGMQTVENILK